MFKTLITGTTSELVRFNSLCARHEDLEKIGDTAPVVLKVCNTLR